MDDHARSMRCCVPCETDQAMSRAIHSHGGRESRVWQQGSTLRRKQENRIASYALVNLKPKWLVIKNCTWGIVLLKLTTDRHETSRGLFATAELLVKWPCKHTHISMHHRACVHDNCRTISSNLKNKESLRHTHSAENNTTFLLRRRYSKICYHPEYIASERWASTDVV